MALVIPQQCSLFLVYFEDGNVFIHPLFAWVLHTATRSARKYDENKFEAIKRNQSHKRHFSFLLINFPLLNGDADEKRTAFPAARKDLMPAFLSQ